MQLRPYQTNAIAVLREILSSGKMRVILYSPTGSGKTEMGMELIRKALEKAKKIIFVCNRIDLVRQTSERVNAAGIQHGIIQGANTCMLWEPMKICSIQTLDKREYPDADLIVIDEAHGTAGSKAYQRFMEHFKNIPIIGLTATPFSRGMAKKYEWGQMWEDITEATTIRKLIDEKFLVDCDIYAPDEPDLSKVKIVAGDYNEEQLGVAVDKPKLVGDIVLHWVRLSNQKPTVCFATNIAHSKHIVEEFTKAGIIAEHLDCYTDNDERKKILARVKNGKTKIISNVGILQEGWDFPACEVMILARPTRSLIKYIQMAGRILRPFEGKEKALILDHSGTCRRLGFPTDDLPLKLDDGTRTDKEKRDAEEEKRKNTLPIICKQCSAVLVHSSSKCPKCGYQIPQKTQNITVQDGELVKVKAGKGNIAGISQVDRNRIYAELRGYASRKGFKDGWAFYKCQEIFGTVPRMAPSPIEPSSQTLKLVKHLQIRYAKAKQKERERQEATL